MSRDLQTLIFRGLPLMADSRTLRNGELLGNAQYHTWEKKEKLNFPELDVVSFPLSKDGGGMLYKYPLYLIYLFFFSLFKINKNHVCVCMDLDTFVPIWLGSFFKKTVLIFDVVDPASQARFKKFPFPRLIDRVESFFIGKSHLAMFPHDCRVSYYADMLGRPLLHRQVLIVENMPSFSYDNDVQPIGPIADAPKLVIGYFGTLDGSRGLDLLLSFAVDHAEEIDVVVAGDGPLRTYVEQVSTDSTNVSFLGRYTASQLSGLYARIHFSWMYYDPRFSLHRYAAPNKFYEHLCFHVPVLTNNVIPQSTFVSEQRTGIVIDHIDHPLLENGRIKSELLSVMRAYVPGPSLGAYWAMHCSNYYSSISSVLRASVLEIKQ
ncbi:hypothetical protein [uncultured Pseudomonas sp.]|uniref:glycosyltransferase n=1 Tax=uncultured Pseudomonas sp. TaxID=114707 RepID=UPI00258ED0AF|nr:hypothetical protein [uncultured Pseudomonas sp.]